MIKYLYYLRSKLINAKQYDSILSFKYQIRSRLGYLRGLGTYISGKIIMDNNTHPLILGNKTELLIRPGCAIILESNKTEHSSDTFYNNPIYPKATSIGLSPYFLALDPPTNQLTRISLNNGSKMIMGVNTAILPGVYITANNHAEIFIGDNSYISQEVTINSRSRIIIGKNVMLGQQVKIMDYDAHDIFSLNDKKKKEVINKSQPVIIQDKVWIGVRATILKGVTIGSGSIVGANSCVTSDVPSNVIVAGNPAKIIKENIKWER